MIRWKEALATLYGYANRRVSPSLFRTRGLNGQKNKAEQDVHGNTH